MEDRVPTGIEGFDELCEGGLPRNGAYLVSGSAGSGKTIFALQYLYNGITKFGENGIFLTTDERPEDIRKNALKFGWDLQKLEDEGKLAFIDGTSTKIGLPSKEKYVDVRPFDTHFMTDQLITIQKELKAKRAVLDSSTALGIHIQDPARIRVELLRICTTLKLIGLTSLVTCEILSEEDEKFPTRFGVESFVTDGAIILYFKRSGPIRVRAIEIMKMRGTSHDTKIHPFEITSSGIIVHPKEEVY